MPRGTQDGARQGRRAGGTLRRRLFGAAPPVLLLLMLLLFGAGCAPMTVQLKELIDAGQYDEAVKRGERFLDENRYGPALPDELVKVESLIADAALAAARRQDTVQAYRKFRKAVPETQATQKQHSQAYRYEAAAWYRDITLRADSLEAHRAFRKRYPGTPTVGKSRLREAQIAFAAAQRQGTMAALDRFRLLYKRWPEAKGVVAKAMGLEAKVGFDEARRSGSVDKWRAFNARFPNTEWSRRGLVEEIKLALHEAQGRDTVAAYQAFSSRYGKLPEAARYLSEARRREVAAAWRALGQRPTDQALVAFLQRYEFWPEAKGYGPGGRQRLAAMRLEVAVGMGTQAALEQWISVHADWKHIDDVRRQARRALVVLALTAARNQGTRAGFEAFIARFRGWPEAKRELIEATRLAQEARR